MKNRMRSKVAAIDLSFGSARVAAALSGVVQVIMYEGHNHGSLADCGSHALHGLASVSSREYPRPAGFQKISRHVIRSTLCVSAIRVLRQSALHNPFPEPSPVPYLRPDVHDAWEATSSLSTSGREIVGARKIMK